MGNEKPRKISLGEFFLGDTLGQNDQHRYSIYRSHHVSYKKERLKIKNILYSTTANLLVRKHSFFKGGGYPTEIILTSPSDCGRHVLVTSFLFVVCQPH